MADSPTDPNVDDDAGALDDESPPGMPRWVKVSGLIGLVLVLLLVGLAIFGGGHRPGRHGPPTRSFERADVGDRLRTAGAREVAVTARELASGVDRIEVIAGEPASVALRSAHVAHVTLGDAIAFRLAEGHERPRTYLAYDSVPGHRAAGIEFETAVTASGGGSRKARPAGARR